MASKAQPPTTSLPQRPLGTTGIKLSLLGLGLVKIGRNADVKYPEAFKLPSDDEVLALLGEAQNLGVTLLDTAPAYGTSEERLGHALTQYPEFARRCVISTKVGETWGPGGSIFDFTPDAIRRSVERSLIRLHREHLDIVLLHSSGADVDIITQHQPLNTLQELQQEGLIKVCGFSGKTVAGGRLALQEGAKALMVTYNLQETEQVSLLAAAAERGAGVLIKKPLASGYANPEALQDIAKQAGVSAIVSGTRNPAHLRENAELLSG